MESMAPVRLRQQEGWIQSVAWESSCSAVEVAKVAEVAEEGKVAEVAVPDLEAGWLKWLWWVAV